MRAIFRGSTMEHETTVTQKPLVSVVIEGYNESRSLGTAVETLEALQRQNFPLDQVEVVLVGSSAQTDEWNKLHSLWTPFHSVKVTAIDSANYFDLKNNGAKQVSGEIIAFVDSDARPAPDWIASIVESIRGGADMVVGPSLFRTSRLKPDMWLMQAAASISWGFVIGKGKDRRDFAAVNCVSHNVAYRADVFRLYQFRTDLGRTCSPTLLRTALAKDGRKIALHPQQQVAHIFFSWRWWLMMLHFRYGYEVHLLRRLDKTYPNQWIARTKMFEPLVTMAWHVLLDVPRWLRVSRLLGLPPGRRLAIVPVVIVLSVAARGAEMIGMYSTILAPNAMKRWAEAG